MQHDNLLEVLQSITTEMINRDLWQDVQPDSSALASTQPFCVDTLTFCEWMQWIMIPRLEHMANTKQPLPGSSDIHAMAEEAFKLVDADTTKLQALVFELDKCLRVTH